MAIPRPVGAAIDLGSTSVHLLVARPGIDGLTVLDDESAFLGLGAAIDAGQLGADGRVALVAAVGGFVERARALGAASPLLIGTEPLRRLSDAAQIVADIDVATGVRLAILEHEEEALLTLIGLTGGRIVTADLLVVDIGGGSTELVETGPDRPVTASGVRVGAGRLTRAVVSSDPPTAAQFAALRNAADQAFAWSPARPPAEVAFVGGTASNLLKLLRRAGDPEHEDRLDRAALDAAREIVQAAPAATLAATHLMREARIRLLAAGAAIIETVLDRVDAPSGRVVDAGIREGAILVADRAGDAWRARLEELARGWHA